MRAMISRTIRILRAAIVLLGAALLLTQSARAALPGNARDALREADALFAAGRLFEARAAYAALAGQQPNLAPAWLRLGIAATLRAEPEAADSAFLAALRASPTANDSALLRLYQGALAARAGDAAQAQQYWARIGDDSPLAGMRRLLAAELLLGNADYPGAEATYHAALAGGLPAAGRALAQSRLALLRASSDPAAARALLAEAPAGPVARASMWTAPLLPPATPGAGQIAAALDAPAAERPQLLGQIYLGARLYALAEAQFAAVDPNGSNALAAAAYAAYTRWSAGDRAEGLRRLEALAASNPAEPRARALLALALLNNRDDEAARRELAAVRELAPRSPDTHLAWGQWYVAQHDYVAAADAYRQALRDAPAEQRGNYALALARFYVDTDFQLCANGQPAANTATRALPDEPRAWAALAAAELSCANASEARAAAEHALQLAPTDAEAAYYLGRALGALGERAPARQALIHAADSAPASAWRVRAEQQMAALGL